MTTGAEVLAPTLDLRTELLQHAMFTVAFGGMGEDPMSTGYFVAGVNETAKTLRSPSIWTTEDHDEMRHAFGQLCEKVATLGDFDADRDGFMDRLGRPARMADVVRGAVLADREHWLGRLAEMAK